MKPLLIFIGFLPGFGFSVICNQHSSGLYTNMENATCEGDLCVIAKVMEYRSIIYQTCVSGASMLSSKCDLTFGDSLICYCDTDYCNNQTLLTSSEMEIVPIIECRKVVLSQFTAATCNYCARQLEYLKTKNDDNTYIETTNEHVGCADGHFESEVLYYDESLYPTKLIYYNYFVDGCYNITMRQNSQFTAFCRCSQKNCNDPTEDWPYPISEPTVTCQTSGLLVPTECYYGDNCGNWTYYEYLNNTKRDDFYDGECRGHLCFIAKGYEGSNGGYSNDYFKGCISLNEQGERKLQLGYSFLRQLHLWVCDTDYCNSNIQTTLEEAKNSTGRKLLNSSSSQYFSMIFSSFVLLFSHIFG